MTFSKTQQSNRKPKAAKAKKPRKALKRQSDKGVAFEREFEAAKKKFFNDGIFVCSACKKINKKYALFPWAPDLLFTPVRQAATLHHVLPRSAGGDNSRENLLPVCHNCHEWIHAHPKIALKIGLLKSRYNRKAKGE